MTEEMIIDPQAFGGSQEEIDSIQEAIKKLSGASQDQFEEIKKEKWYTRLFDMVTFSQKGKKRTSEQISTLAQAQQVLLEILLRLSNSDVRIAKMISESMASIRQLSEQDIYLLEKVNQLQNIALGIKPDTDVRNLSERDKRILSACLFKISEKNSDPSEKQQRYANAVISYLAVDMQMENPSAAFDGMDENAKRRVLSCCMEYLFLKDDSLDSLSEYEDLIYELNIGPKTIKTIKAQIEAINKLRGFEGFISKYSQESYQEISDSFLLDVEDDINDTEDVCEEEIELSEEVIGSILQISHGETKVIQNKKLHISAFINCEGTLVIDHCILYYNETDLSDEITLAEGANISIKNSCVVCKGYDKDAFIGCKGTSSVLFESTTFVDCAYFLSSNTEINFTMRECRLENCYDRFVNIQGGYNTSCNMEHNIILNDDLALFYYDGESPISKSPYLIYICCASRKPSESHVLFSDNYISIDNKNIIKGEGFALIKSAKKLPDAIVFNCLTSQVINCSFVGLTAPIESEYVKNCKFINCDGAIHAGSPVVDNCVFEDSKNAINSRWGGASITNCQFIGCKDRLIDAKSDIAITYCQFASILNTASGFICSILPQPCIQLSNGNDSGVGKISHCIFENVELNEGFLIAAERIYEKPKGIMCKVEACDFRNCSTKRKSGAIIKQYVQYDTIFKKDIDFHAIIVENCKGLDQINKESEMPAVVIRETSTTGIKLGSTIAMGAAGAAAFVVGGPIGLCSVAAATAATAVANKIRSNM